MSEHSLEAICDRFRSGARLKFLFFWGHETSRVGHVGKECLSQWYPAAFTVDGLRFPTAEHFMMYRKAMLFGDEKAAADILRAPSPGAAKALGRSVHGFDQQVWETQRSDIVVAGNLAKFSQSANLREFLVATEKRVLVEASPVDRIWGVGLAADDEHIENPLHWRGLNLLGFALMDVRVRLV
ncbi:MAG: NADAR family protein [Myxococcota bacterium]